jgi:hypothetical protein
VKVGAENRTKLIAAVCLGALALFVVATRFVGFMGMGSSNAAAPALGEATTQNERPLALHGSGKTRSGGKQPTRWSLDPTLHSDLLKTTEETKYEGTGRNIFRVFVEPPPKVVQTPVLDHPAVADNTPPQPPPPPPINLKFYGFATPAGGSKRIFLADKEDVFIAMEGEIVDRRYKVVKISPNAVEILDVLSNNRQSIPLTQG